MLLPAWNYLQLGIAAGGLIAFVLGWILILRTTSDGRSSSDFASSQNQPSRHSTELSQLSVRTAAVSVVLVVAEVLRYGTPPVEKAGLILLLGVAKALNWYYTFQIVSKLLSGEMVFGVLIGMKGSASIMGSGCRYPDPQQSDGAESCLPSCRDHGIGPYGGGAPQHQAAAEFASRESTSQDLASGPCSTFLYCLVHVHRRHVESRVEC